jgi:SPP1 gp7 family putative phage head morphogenesis protein
MSTATSAAVAVDASPMITLVHLLGPREAGSIIELSRRTQTLEREWVRTARAAVADVTDAVLTNAAETGRIKTELVNFVDLFVEHAFDTTIAGYESTQRVNPVRAIHLARAPDEKIPRSLRATREAYDRFRKNRKATARARLMAERLKEAYIKKLQQAWRELADDFLNGSTYDQERVAFAIAKRANVTQSRAKTIVETETTRYFNNARREVYDASEDVTHYLYVAIRDHVTTKWCKSRQGLVYAKADPLLDKETPPIHWNCRSELIPLTPANPNHLRLIQDRGRSRRHNRPEPLPAGWTGRQRAS